MTIDQKVASGILFGLHKKIRHLTKEVKSIYYTTKLANICPNTPIADLREIMVHSSVPTTTSFMLVEVIYHSRFNFVLLFNAENLKKRNLILLKVLFLKM